MEGLVSVGLWKRAEEREKGRGKRQERARPEHKAKKLDIKGKRLAWTIRVCFSKLFCTGGMSIRSSLTNS